ncbi:MAG: hypothetical protein H0T62_00805 [Parachlamydiaceae bacterium]|nr:hypothetical protein [Parachlamydiaceae bacterium]
MHRDYIMRIMEQFIQAVLAIVMARKAKNFEEAFYQIQNASQRYLLTDIADFLKMSPEKLLEHFKENGKYIDIEQCIMCAELLYETALIGDALKQKDLSRISKILSFHLYLNVIPIEKRFQAHPYMDKVIELKHDLENEVLPETVANSLVTYQKKDFCKPDSFKQ